MAAANSDEMAAKAVIKRYEGLAMVRTKAIKGKGAWYWAHLEPLLVSNSDTGLPKAVKLRCSLCNAVFSASNPSRTASEHLKRGTCPNFASSPNPISSMPPSSSATPPSSRPPHNHRKRTSSSGGARVGTGIGAIFPPHHAVNPPLAIVDPSRFTVDSAGGASPSGGGGGLYGHHHQQQQQLMLSGGKEDLGALAMLEDSVKRLKSPKASPRPALSKAQVESALNFLADWVYECCGSVSFSSLDHPKFKAFFTQVGLPPISKREFAASRLDAKYEEAKADCDAKIHDAMFFQIIARDDENLVQFAVNLPNGTTVFRRAIFTSCDEILWDTITDICGSNLQQCVGIVSDKFKAKALSKLENQHPWMVNLCCQYKGFTTLIKDFWKELPLFKNVATNCLKLATLVNNNSQIRHTFQKYQLQEYSHSHHGGLFTAPSLRHETHTLVEDILSSARALHLLLSDETFKLLLMEDAVAREVDEMMRNPHFWNELEAVHSLVKLIKTMARDFETEKPRIGQCLPLWEELRVKVKDWCSKFHINEGPVEKVIKKRFEKNYHPAWAAAFILDPLYLIRDATGKYLPPFKCLSPDQERDVEKVITRLLVSREEARVALMELVKWRTEGLDPVYAQAVQLRQRDPNTGKMRIANTQSSRLVWETHLTELKSLGKVAVRLIFLHSTSSCGYKCKWSLLRWIGVHSRSRVGMDRAQKLMFIAAHSKMEKQELTGDNDDDDDDDDTELFALANGEEDHVLNEVFVDTSSVSI